MLLIPQVVLKLQGKKPLLGDPPAIGMFSVYRNLPGFDLIPEQPSLH